MRELSRREKTEFNKLQKRLRRNAGNAIVDVISHGDDSFLENMGITKGIMQLVERDRAETLYAAMEERTQAPGGSVANTLAAVLAGAPDAVEVGGHQQGGGVVDQAAGPPDARAAELAVADREIPEKIRRRPPSRTTGGAGQVVVEGIGDLMTQMAKCCKRYLVLGKC